MSQAEKLRLSNVSSDVFYQVKDNFCNWFNSSKSLYFLKNYINALYPLLKSAIIFYNAIIRLFEILFY